MIRRAQRKPELYVSSRMARRLPELADALGQDGAALCVRHRVPRAVLEDPNARLPLDPIVAALEELASVTRHPSLGLRLAAQATLDTYHTPALILLASDCLQAGLERTFQFQRLWGDGQRFALRTPAEIGRTGDGLAVTFGIPALRRPGQGILEVCALAEVARAVRGLTGRAHECPLALGVPTTTDDLDALTEHFGIRPQRGASPTSTLPSG